MSDQKLDLIANLLRKAERTDNEHEAEAFLKAAQKLATKNSIDLAMARAHTSKSEKREEPVEETIVIGTSGKRGLAQYVRLFMAIGEVNDLHFLIAHDSTKVYASGFPSDIEQTKVLYASLLIQMVQAGDAYLRSGEYKAEKVWVEGGYRKTGERYYDSWEGRYVRREEWVDGHYKPVHGTVARRSFYEGFTNRVTARLQDAKQEATAEAEATSTPSTEVDATGQALSSMALVLRDKKAEVDLFFAEKRKRARGSWKGGRGAQGSSGSARSAGIEAGNRARLSGQQSLPAGRSKICA